MSAPTATGEKARNRKNAKRRQADRPKTFLTIAIIVPECIKFFLWLGRE